MSRVSGLAVQDSEILRLWVYNWGLHVGDSGFRGLGLEVQGVSV